MQLFKQHQAILGADEMVEELEGTIRIAERRINQLRAENLLMSDRHALYTIWKSSDRLSLIKETRQHGLAEAIRRYQQRSQQPR